ncbi:MAG: hypothetical protein QOF01_4076 [Thermomicrobiales bacterium]|nr:hypothetical protein [Thermomicrobiales bacterium]
MNEAQPRIRKSALLRVATPPPFFNTLEPYSDTSIKSP